MMTRTKTAQPDRTLSALLVEDSTVMARALRDMLEHRERFRLTHVDRLEKTAEVLERQRFDVVLLDLSLPDSDGLQTVQRACAMAGDQPIMVLTANDDDALGNRAIRCGAEDYLVKDRIDETVVYRAACHAIERNLLRRERDALIEKLSAALERVAQLSGLLPICAHCKRIRDEQGEWRQLELYVRERSAAEFSHGICPSCMQEHYEEG